MTAGIGFHIQGNPDLTGKWIAGITWMQRTALACNLQFYRARRSQKKAAISSEDVPHRCIDATGDGKWKSVSF
jgi:hypothetical protein